jgi:hypothetical protein
MLAWSINQRFALLCQERFPNRVHIVRAEDVMANPRETLGEICVKLGLEAASSLARPSWNGQTLEEVFPWGTIRKATAAANRTTAEELSQGEREAVKAGAGPYLSAFDYSRFLLKAA